MTILWIAITFGAIGTELATEGLVSIWFACGGLVSIFLSLLDGIAWYWQVLAFIAVSVLLLVFLRPIVQKAFKASKDQNSNLDALIGQKVRMLTTATFDTNGTVKLNGVIWTALHQNGDRIEKDTIVEILQIKGNKLIVRPVSETDSQNQ